MKKLTAILLAMCLAACPAACLAEETDYSYLEDMSVKELKALRNAIDNILSSEDAGVATAKDSAWMVDYYVDEFDEPTDKAFVTNTDYLEGTFSNKVTEDSYLLGFFQIEEDKVCLKLYTYGEYPVTSLYDKETYYDVAVLDQRKDKHTYYGVMNANGDAFFIHDNLDNYSCAGFIEILKRGGTIKLRIDDSKGYIYNLDVNCNGFEDAFSEYLDKQ